MNQSLFSVMAKLSEGHIITSQWAGGGNRTCPKYWSQNCHRRNLSDSYELHFGRFTHFHFPAIWISCFWPTQPTVHLNYFCPKIRNIPIFSIFRVAFLATQGGISNRFSVSGILRGISKGFISEISLNLVFGSFMRRHRGKKSLNWPIFFDIFKAPCLITLGYVT